MTRTTRNWLLASLSVALLAGLGGVRPGTPALRADEAKEEGTPNTLTDKEKKEGWDLLFDGKTTKGWRRYKGKGMPEKWKVIDGALVLKAKEKGSGGDIVTEDEYDNFELKFDWKVTPGANSGVMYRVSEKYGAPYETGPEYQVLDNKKHADGRNPKTSAASCYALYAPSKDVTKPVGEWNHGRIVVHGNKVEHWLNDTKVVSYEFGSDDWNERVKRSKFKGEKDFGKMKKGYIDLQDHGDEIAYRNIKIRALKKEGK
jgi:hypothetical protein